MYLHDAPSLEVINQGNKLRLAATRMQSQAAIMFNYGSNWGRESLVPFWQFQKAQVNKTAGLPSDGPYLGSAYQDPRNLCYQVLSSIRLQGNKKVDVDAWDKFCDYFIQSAYSLDDNRSPVDTLRVTPVYKDGRTSVAWDDKDLSFLVVGVDATGKDIPASVDNPLLGLLDWMMVTEGTPELQGKWRNRPIKVTSTPQSHDVGGVSTRKEGDNSFKYKYTYLDKEVIQEVIYVREAAEKPKAAKAAEPVEGSNGIA